MKRLELRKLKIYLELNTVLFTLMCTLYISAGCAAHRNNMAQKTAMATPKPLLELQTLPINAQARCDDNPNYRSKVALWERPGLDPVDSDSSSQSNTGKRLGWLEACTEIEIIDLAWSETDQEFYVYAKTNNLEGWLVVSLVDFAP